MATNRKTPPFNIILLGDPAAGKATQAEYLGQQYNLYDFDMGKELAKLRRRDKSIDHNLKSNNDKGKMTPTKIARGILKETIEKIPTSKGILFDGHPKMLGEAQMAARLIKQQKRIPPVVIYISIPIEETVKRMADRVGYFAGKYGKRADDNNQALKNRVKYYRTNIADVVNFFSNHYEYHKISGLGSRFQVKQEINRIVKNYLKKIENGEIH